MWWSHRVAGFVIQPSCGWMNSWWCKKNIPKKKKIHRMSKVWPFIWVLSLDYDFEEIWGLSRWGFNFTEARSFPVGPYKGVCISSVDIGNHLVANYQCKKGSRSVEITGFHVGGSSVGGARRFFSTRPLQYLSKFETMTGPCPNPQRPWSQKKNVLVRNLASTSIDVGPVQKIALTTSFDRRGINIERHPVRSC